MQIYELILYFFIYSFLGWCAEVAFATVKERRFVNRGFLNGPLCPIYGVGVTSVVVLLAPFRDRAVLLYLSSFVLVTLIEGLTGFVMDRLFHHKWWDYTGLPLSIGGYVCLPFSLVWGLACVVIVKAVHPLIGSAVGLLHVSAGLALACVFLAGLAADVAVTTAGILKLNRRLDMLERIGAELREISDRMGSNIYENVMEGLDYLGDEPRERYEELRKRYDELRGRYAVLTGATLQASRRLVRAFPKMQSRHHRDLLDELRKRLEEAAHRR
ncbi:putative ABC transporter permease [Mordavella massiliensis]|uniref:ABC transporter permease n=1 Tax=Mordavella massiliensis TaxID=1871024 RepID=A0A939BGW9_9CLOT|nr:hypothetical protein [Mordavella massiliensis]MBM6948161.1 hypothetical protein [Mordavella massiliensis]